MSRTAQVHPPSRWLGGAAEVLLGVLSIVAFAGLARVFSDDAWVRPVMVALIVGHVVAAAGRHLRVHLALVAVIMAALAVEVSALIHYGPTLRGGVLPTGATRQAADADLTAAFELFGDISTPAPADVGFILLVSAAAWLTAFLADWAAFRLWSATEAILPALAVLVFIGFFGEDADRLLYTGLLAAAVVAFVLCHRLARESRTARWLGDHPGAGRAALLRIGAVLGSVAVIVALLAGPRVPGSEDQALVDLTGRDSGGESSRVVVSPMVDIRARLVNQSRTVAFTVRSPEPSYWRLAGLDRFDGRVWGSQTSYGRADGPLPVGTDFGSDQRLLQQQFEIVQLGAVWLPAAFEPRALTESSSDEVRYEPTSGTLIVDRALESSNGLSYTLSSAIPAFDPAVLDASTTPYPPEIATEFLELPADFSPAATALARQLTEGSTGRYDAALRLQNYFRDTFTYDLDVAQGHSSNRIEDFLALQRGYCEQFAGSFAAMARSVGLPARVAVGFTWGEVAPDDENLYIVRGEHAHAWPEVYFPEAGWVAFEPTPGRGAPGAEGWTGVAPAQEGSDPGADGGPDVAATPTPIPSTAGGLPPEPATQPDLAAGTAPADDNVQSGSSGAATVLRWMGIVLVAALAWIAVIAGAKELRRRLRRSRAGDNRRRITVAWNEALLALRRIGVRNDTGETPMEFARRASTAALVVGPRARTVGQCGHLRHLRPHRASGPDGRRRLRVGRRSRSPGDPAHLARATTPSTRRPAATVAYVIHADQLMAADVFVY